MASKTNPAQVTELLLQALETERGGIQIYTAAIAAAQNEDLKKEWGEYLEETRTHEQVLTRLLGAQAPFLQRAHFLRADVCRRELRVEIEALGQASGTILPG